MKIPENIKTIGAFIIVIVLIAIFFIPKNKKVDDGLPPLAFNKPLSIGGALLNVDFATLPPTQERGLSGTKSLGEGEGLLFVFPTETQIPFWMKQMNYPIDIIWINGAKKVTEIEKNVSPDTYPAQFTADKQFQYVLEVNAGFADKNNIKEGSDVLF